MGHKIHHSVRNGSDKCDRCKRPRLMHWRDAQEKNGGSEVFRVFRDADGKVLFRDACEECYLEMNNGKPSLGLRDLNEIRERGITSEQFYKEHGY